MKTHTRIPRGPPDILSSVSSLRNLNFALGNLYKYIESLLSIRTKFPCNH